MTGSRRVLGVRVDDVTYADTLARIRWWLRVGGHHQVATVNPEYVMAARRDPSFAALLDRTALNVPDGTGLAIACRLFGRPLRQTVRGVALTERIAARSAREGWRVFLLGAAPGVAEATADALQRRFPGIQIAGTFAGRSDPAGDADARAAIAAAGQVDVLLVAYGSPAQDWWIDRNRVVPVAIGVGGTFDYLAGAVRRPHPVITRLGFEWLYRLATQPHRWRRIATAVVGFGGTIAIGWLLRRPVVR